MLPIALTISSCDSSTARVRTQPVGRTAAAAAAGGCGVLAPETLGMLEESPKSVTPETSGTVGESPESVVRGCDCVSSPVF